MTLFGGPTTGLGRIFDPPPAVAPEDELAQAYRDDATEHGLEVEGDRPFLEWAADVPEPKRALDLDRFRFQRELYSSAGELAREIVVVKAAQIGVSAWLIRWALRRADLGATVLYVMPRERQATEFSTMRVKPVLLASRYLRHRQRVAEDATDTKRLKSIGTGYLAVRGSTSTDEVTSVDADAVALDEYDRLEPTNLPRVEQRVTGPMSQGLIRRVSTPTLPGWGIAREFAKTDQRRWRVRCGGLDRRGRKRAGCGEWVPMKGTETFLEVLDHETATLRCPSCRRPLDVREGEWVADLLDGDRPRGYHMPKFVVPGIDLRALIARSEATTEQGKRAHHNEDLGEPWQPADAGLTLEQILAAVRDYTMDGSGYIGRQLVTMGVDVAASRALNVRISEHLDEHTKRALWIGTIDDGLAPWGGMAGVSAFEILSEIMRRFRVTMAVIDHMPDPRLVRAWCESWRGRAYRVGWSDTQKVVLARPKPKDDPTKLSARYLEGIDSTLDLVRRHGNLLPRERPTGYDEQLQARVLVTEEDPDTGEVRQSWLRTGPDDFLQAEAYDVIATHMAYVHQAQGSIGNASGHLVAARQGVVEQVGDWQRAGADDDLDYSAGPSEDPLSGWE